MDINAEFSTRVAQIIGEAILQREQLAIQFSASKQQNEALVKELDTVKTVTADGHS